MVDVIKVKASGTCDVGALSNCKNLTKDVFESHLRNKLSPFKLSAAGPEENNSSQTNYKNSFECPSTVFFLRQFYS